MVAITNRIIISDYIAYKKFPWDKGNMIGIRLYHIPTEISVYCETFNSKQLNLDIAFILLNIELKGLCI